MSRPPLSEKAKREVCIHLIQTAQSIVSEEGLESVTIRKIANRSNCNSAMLYRYFKDLDELLLFACIDFLKDYSHELILASGLDDPEKDYMLTWDLFCKYAFRYPDIINHLFFSKHSDRLDSIIKNYYDLFPDQLKGMSVKLQSMLRFGNLFHRNLAVLQPVLCDSVTDKQLNLINDLTISYFRSLLDEKLQNGDAVDDSDLTHHMLDACQLLIALK